MSVKRYIDTGRWEGIEEHRYGSGDDFRSASRYKLIEGDDVTLRYFELGKEGYSRREKHAHEHLVVIMCGRGAVLMKDNWVEVEPHDAIHIAAWEEHQLKNCGEEPFGFLCAIRRNNL